MDNFPHIKKPDTKQYHHAADTERRLKALESPLQEILPLPCYRISYLENPSKQLDDLFTRFERTGIPTGAKDWAFRAQIKFEYLKGIQEDVWRFLNDYNETGKPNMDSLIQRLEHRLTMWRKYLPKPDKSCDWCGWPGGKPVGEGYAACDDCNPKRGYRYD